MDIHEKLKAGFVFCDGGTGTVLQAQGLGPGQQPELWNLDHPEKDDLHWRRYVNSRMRDGKLEIVFRELVEEGQNYEHCH